MMIIKIEVWLNSHKIQIQFDLEKNLLILIIHNRYNIRSRVCQEQSKILAYVLQNIDSMKSVCLCDIVCMYSMHKKISFFKFNC